MAALVIVISCSCSSNVVAIITIVTVDVAALTSSGREWSEPIANVHSCIDHMNGSGNVVSVKLNVNL